MKVKELREYLDTFADDAQVELWRWTTEGGRVSDCMIAANQEHQLETQTVTLTQCQGTERPE